MEFVVIETTSEEGGAALEKLKENQIASINVVTPTAKPNEPIRTFFIIETNEVIGDISSLSKREDEVYNVVEKTATPVGGIPEFYQYIMQNMQYPNQAREKGIEGKVFIEFVIQRDGSLSGFNILKGVDPDLDQDALRVLAPS